MSNKEKRVLSILYYSKGPKFFVNVWARWRTWTLTDEGLLYWPFFNYVVSLYSGPCFLHGSPQHLWALLIALLIPFCLLNWPSDHFVCGYLCIYYFIMPTYSFHMTYFSYSFVYTAGISCVEISKWWVC